MAQSETVQRILDAAEQLFVERGFSETSLRLITSKAKVNLAAVNYHFGSKNALVQAVLSRVLTPFSRRLEQALDQRDARGQRDASVDELLELLVGLAVQAKGRGEELSAFVRLVGLAFTEAQGELQDYLGFRYGPVFRRYMALFQSALPGLSRLELYWRLYFVLGAATFTLSGNRGLHTAMESRFGTALSLESLIQLMLPFLGSGLHAPATRLELLSAASLES